MFASSVLDKENAHGEVLVSTPARKPLKTLQAISQNAVSEGTPSGLLRKTPKHKLSNITPSSKKHSRRISKRQSVSMRLPKAVSIFDDEMFAEKMDDTPTNMMVKITDCEETGLHESQELNEMLRKKVFETVTKLRKRYELCLAEKEKDLHQQCSIIEQLKKEVDILKQDQKDNNKNVKFTKFPEESQNLCEDEQVSLLVQHVLSKVVKEMENSDCRFGGKINSTTGPITPVSDVHLMTSPTKQINSETSVNSLRQMFPEKSETSVKQVSTETSMISLTETSMTPGKQVDALTLTTPIKQASSETLMTPVKQVDALTSITPIKQASSETSMTPVKQVDALTSMTPIKQASSETSMTPVKQVDALTSMTPIKQASSETSMTPVKQVDALTSMTPIKQANSETSITPLKLANTHTAMTPVPIQKNSSDPSNTPTMSCTNVATSMTPIEHVNQDTMVSPVKMQSTAIGTSPLVAVLQPEMITQLPLETLRSELESAAISNELLRSECDELNGKVEDLESLLKEVRNSASKESGVLQERIDQLQNELEEALEINYQMELKKPHSIEEYEDVIQRLQKDVLLKEKQIAFYTKKASETDNLQNDLRRMYVKYTTEHESSTELNKKMESLASEYDVKCGELETMQAELNNLRIELSEAKATIDAQGKIWEEAKRSQVKCCTLEEQIETFQCQQKENVEFLEQERKGLEETNIELEQMVRKHSVELDATKYALEEKTSQHEHLWGTTHSLRTQLSEVQDELNAVQSQAYLVMLEQEKELTTVTRVLEEAWERLNTMIHTVKKQALSWNEEKACKSDEEDMVKEKNECDSSAGFKPSLVCSILVAVSGTAAAPQADGKNSIVQEDNEQQQQQVQSNSFVEDLPSEDERDPSNFTLVQRASSLSELLRELEDYTCGSVVREQAKKHMDEINDFANNLAETRQRYEIEINVLKEELANGYDAVMEGQRDNDHKQIEIESLKMILETTEQNFQTSRERMTELSEKYCRLIEQETENEALNENLRIVQRECEKLKKEKSLLKKELDESIEKLRETLETNNEPDVEKRKTKVQKRFTQLFEEKLKLQREVEKLSDSYLNSRMERETFTHYNAKLETKASILANNLVKAEEEIYRLDGIIDRFCSVAQQNQEMAAQNKDLCDLLKELNINIE